MTTIAWAPADDKPEKNERVLVWLEGYKNHSGANWERSGYFLLGYHGIPRFSERVVAAGIELDADYLEVKRWARLPPPQTEGTE